MNEDCVCLRMKEAMKKCRSAIAAEPSQKGKYLTNKEGKKAMCICQRIQHIDDETNEDEKEEVAEVGLAVADMRCCICDSLKH